MGDHQRPMAGRRLMLFVVLLVVIGAVASATVPREDRQAVRTPPEAQPAQPPADVVRAALPGRREVRARVGDVIEIQVKHDAADIVQVVALGIEEPVEPGIAAQLVFDADRAGRFGVTLREAGRRIGTIAVREAG
jgi:hypothetical protein